MLRAGYSEVALSVIADASLGIGIGKPELGATGDESYIFKLSNVEVFNGLNVSRKFK
jgi:hypothetical protein